MIKILWALIKVLDMVAGIMFLASGAMLHTIHWLYDIPIPLLRISCLMLIGLILLAVCTYSYSEWHKKLLAFKYLIIYSLGCFYPLFLGSFLLRRILHNFREIQVFDIILVAACVIIVITVYRFLDVRKFLLHSREKYQTIQKTPDANPSILNDLFQDWTREYRATFKSMLGLTIVLLLLTVLFFVGGILGKNLSVTVIGIFFLFFLLFIRIRFKVVIKDGAIASTGFFNTRSIRLAEVIKTQWMGNNRFYGPFVYEMRTPDNYIRINFKLFDKQCMAEVLEKMEAMKDRCKRERNQHRE